MQTDLMRRFALAFTLALAVQGRAGALPQAKTDAATEPLKLLISIEQQILIAPFPARVTLHLHNAGPNALWLYRRARPAAQQGSRLDLHLESLDVSPSQDISAAQGVGFESVGLPHPKLIKLSPGEDYEEKTALRLAPAQAGAPGGGKPLWGRYRLSVVYGARFSNAEEISRNLGVEVWQGEVTSNGIEVELRPAAAGAQGWASGTVVGPSEHPLSDIVVSLSDEQERLIAQLVTGVEGRFSFTQLPLGLYWVTARLASAQTDTVVFRHLELTPEQPAGALQLVMTPQEIYEPKGMLHKPILFRVKDSPGRPLGKTGLEIVWSNGPVLDHVRGETSDDGTLTLELIPGRNFVTLKRRGCPKEEQRVDVTEGDGIDDFALVFECARQ